MQMLSFFDEWKDETYWRIFEIFNKQSMFNIEVGCSLRDRLDY